MNKHSIAQLKAAAVPHQEPVNFNWRGDDYSIFAKPLSLLEGSLLLQSFIDPETSRVPLKAMPRYQAAIFAATFTDETGAAIWTAAEAEGLDPEFFKLVDSKTARVNPSTDKDLEDAAKKSETTPPNDGSVS